MASGFRTTSVLLQLSDDEARALYFVLELVGGPPKRTPRGHVAQVSQALEAALPHPLCEHRRFVGCGMWHLEGGIQFVTGSASGSA